MSTVLRKIYKSKVIINLCVKKYFSYQFSVLLSLKSSKHVQNIIVKIKIGLKCQIVNKTVKTVVRQVVESMRVQLYH